MEFNECYEPQKSPLGLGQTDIGIAIEDQETARGLPFNIGGDL